MVTFLRVERIEGGHVTLGVCTHYTLTWGSLGISETNRQGVCVGWIDF